MNYISLILLVLNEIQILEISVYVGNDKMGKLDLGDHGRAAWYPGEPAYEEIVSAEVSKLTMENLHELLVIGNTFCEAMSADPHVIKDILTFTDSVGDAERQNLRKIVNQSPRVKLFEAAYQPKAQTSV